MALLSSSLSPNLISLHLFAPKSSTKIPRRFSTSLASLSPPPTPSSSNSSASASQESTSAAATESFPVFGRESSPKSPKLPYNYAFADLNGDPVVRFVQSTESTIERVSSILRSFIVFFFWEKKILYCYTTVSYSHGFSPLEFREKKIHLNLSSRSTKIEVGLCFYSRKSSNTWIVSNSNFCTEHLILEGMIWWFYLCMQVIFDFRFLALLAIGGSLAGSLLCFLNVISLSGISSPFLLLILLYIVG